tara:strand:- start:134 stop:283 length:150 start_codon:yes stop_codon:yes gene_type:complete
MKGFVRVMVKNPTIKDWNIEFKYFKRLQEWKAQFDEKVKRVEMERMEEY